MHEKNYWPTFLDEAAPIKKTEGQVNSRGIARDLRTRVAKGTEVDVGICEQLL